MHHLEWLARDRLSRFESQLATISRSEYLPASTTKALSAVGQEIVRLRSILDEVITYSDQTYLLRHVVLINQKLYTLTNYLGILLRSTNLRNSFEAYFAFEEMSRKLIGEEDRLVISSEWDASPFYIPNPPAVLDGYVFIGMPAFASRNALLLPLAAHELGHAVWRIRSLDGPLITTADLHLRNEIDKDEPGFIRDFGLEQNLFFSSERDRIISDCLRIVGSQCEEIFCDLFGAALFGRSYLYAFDFFLSPGYGTREFDYPSLVDRIRFMKEVTSVSESEILNSESFEKAEPQTRNRPLVTLADKITGLLQPAILKIARDIASKIEYDREGTDTTEDLVRNLRIGIPPRRPASPIDILNAIWTVFLSKRAAMTSFEERMKLTTLMTNLCLKSLEIYEYNRNQ
jgi:hypothetical protein